MTIGGKVVVTTELRDAPDGRLWLDIFMDGSLRESLGPFAGPEERELCRDDFLAVLESMGGEPIWEN